MGKFFRHYALSLTWYTSTWLILNPEDIERAKMSAWLTEMDIPTDSFRAIYLEFFSDFSAEIESIELPSLLGQRSVPLRRERLTSLLLFIHQTALFHLFRVFKKHGLSKFELPIAECTENSVKAAVTAWETIAQAYYSSTKGEMDIAELGLLKFEHLD